MATIKKSFIHKNCYSSGNLFLDKILGGFSVGSTVMLTEDSFSKIYQHFLSYFMAEGMVKDEQNFVFHTCEKELNKLLDSLPYKSSQVESLLNAKKINDLQNEEMKIAWRYENIKYSNLLEDVAKSSDYIFDLSRPMQFNFRKQLVTCNIGSDEGLVGKLKNLNKFLIRLAQEYLSTPESKRVDENGEEESKSIRIIVPSIVDSSDNTNLDDQSIKEIKKQLMILKNVTRSLNGVVLLTFNSLILDSSKQLKNIFSFYLDYVLGINGFAMSNDRIEEYDGLLRISKIPRINSLRSLSHNLEADTFGIIVEKRKVIIEQVDIGVEIDRNTKVKDTTSKVKVNANEIDF